VREPLSIRDEHAVGMSDVHMLSFTVTVIPDRGPSGEVRLGLGLFTGCTKARVTFD